MATLEYIYKQIYFLFLLSLFNVGNEKKNELRHIMCSKPLQSPAYKRNIITANYAESQRCDIIMKINESLAPVIKSKIL